MGVTISSIAGRLNLECGSPSFLPALIFVTDDQRLKDPTEVINALPAGTGVLFRHYHDPKRAELAREISFICKERNLLLIIAGDAKLASSVHANGLHLPEFMVRNTPLEALIWRAQPENFLTAAAHSRKSLAKAAQIGAHAALLSPVFTTKSHPERSALGPLRFTNWARSSQLPVYALGGVTKVNASRLYGGGAVGLAGIGEIEAEYAP